MKPSERVATLMNTKKIGSPEAHIFSMLQAIIEVMDEDYEAENRICTACNGRGLIRAPYQKNSKICPICSGTGEDTCPHNEPKQGCDICE